LGGRCGPGREIDREILADAALGKAAWVSASGDWKPALKGARRWATFLSVPGAFRMRNVYHIAAAADYRGREARGLYTPAAFSEEGFIHCSYREQVLEVANRIFRGRKDLWLLTIERSGPLAEKGWVDENLEGGRTLYPHLYQPLPMSWISAVAVLSPNEDGTFSWPAGIGGA
jgi:uncharacterized protein (DUF952 family)